MIYHHSSNMTMTERGKQLYVFWVFFSIGILLGSFLLKLSKHAHGSQSIKAPVVLESKLSESVCWEDERAVVCFIHNFIFYNPNHKRLEVTIECGREIESSTFVIYPRVKQSFNFSFKGEKIPCKISQWKAVR